MTAPCLFFIIINSLRKIKPVEGFTMGNPVFLDGYNVPEWLADVCARECARGFCGHAVLSVYQLEFLLALAQGATEMI